MVESKIHLEYTKVERYQIFARLHAYSSHENGGAVVQGFGEYAHIVCRMCRLVGIERDGAIFNEVRFAVVVNLVYEQAARLSEVQVYGFAVAAGYSYSVCH